MQREVKEGRVIMGRLPQGQDLLIALNQLCKDQGVSLGEVRAIGAVTKAVVGFYDQDKRQYGFLPLDEPMEILSLTGNVSIKDGKPFVHAHVVLGREDGSAVGGHLAEGSPIFACEVVLRELESQEPFVRGMDEGTSLPLWSM